MDSIDQIISQLYTEITPEERDAASSALKAVSSAYQENGESKVVKVQVVQPVRLVMVAHDIEGEIY